MDEFKIQKLLTAEKDHGVSTAFPPFLPIEIFDDTEYDPRTSDDWLMLTCGDNGEKKPVPGKALLPVVKKSRLVDFSLRYCSFPMCSCTALLHGTVFVFLLVCLFVSIFLDCFFVCLSVAMFVCLSVYFCFHLSVCLSVCLSIHIFFIFELGYNSKWLTTFVL